MRPKDWNAVLAGILLAPIPFVARAETYLTEDQAARIFFPGLHLEPAISLAGRSWPSSRAAVRWGPNHEAMFVDKVLGKHEWITYAVGVGADGRVIGIEILDYRETYGGEIRRPEWRKYFAGKSAKDALVLDRDIPNISGATLSSKHVTEGVRRILQTYEALLAGH